MHSARFDPSADTHLRMVINLKNIKKRYGHFSLEIE